MKITKEGVKLVLWAAIEDYCGLWEIPWELKNLQNSFNESQLKILSLEIIKFLISGGFIELFYCKEPYGDITKISDTNLYCNLLNQSKYWDIPNSGDKSIRINATQKGEKLYQDANYNEYISS
ncbi:MAG: hypothetical protein ACFFD1_02615 [Candidatus Thorarchaeota archaeon]